MNRKNAKSKKKKASGVLLAAVMTVNAGLLAALTAVVLGGESAQIKRKSDMTAYERIIRYTTLRRGIRKYR